MKKILAALFVTLFLCTSAQAFSVSFDKLGTGNDANLIKYDVFQLVATTETITLPAGTVNLNSTPASGQRTEQIWTYQDITTGIFTESFTAMVLGGFMTSPNSFDSFSNVFIDVNLDGTYYNDSNITFTGGNATMYSGANLIASFSYESALISSLSGSLLGAHPHDLGMLINFSFLFDYVNPLYWGDNEEFLVGKKWLLSVVGGSVAQNQIYIDVPSNEYIIGWQFPGAQMEFSTIPEPATMLLFGLGLIGLAGASRRKLS